MRNAFASAAALVALLAVASPASAASVSTLAPGLLVDPNAAADGIGAGLADFNTPASITTYTQTSPSQGPFSVGAVSFSGDGILMTNAGQDALGLYAEPFHDTTQYLTVQPFGPKETVTFGATYHNLGLYWGSMDTYNSIIFYLGGVAIDTVTGSVAAAAIVPPANANGWQADDANNRYVLINVAGGFDKIELISTQNSFEIDNLAWGNIPPPGGGPGLGTTPVPAALPLFGSVIAGGAVFGRWRKRRKAA